MLLALAYDQTAAIVHQHPSPLEGRGPAMAAQLGHIELDDLAWGVVAPVHHDPHVERTMRPNTLSVIAAYMSAYVGIIDATESTP
jgi:hypothetical protein